MAWDEKFHFLLISQRGGLACARSGACAQIGQCGVPAKAQTWPGRKLGCGPHAEVMAGVGRAGLGPRTGKYWDESFSLGMNHPRVPSNHALFDILGANCSYALRFLIVCYGCTSGVRVVDCCSMIRKQNDQATDLTACRGNHVDNVVHHAILSAAEAVASFNKVRTLFILVCGHIFSSCAGPRR